MTSRRVPTLRVVVRVLSLFALAYLSAPASADETALYDAALPADAAFVRFLGFPADGALDYLGTAIPGAVRETGDYMVFRSEETNALHAGQILTVIPGDGTEAKSLNEPARDRAKVLLGLVNLSAVAGITLRTQSGDIAIIDSVAPLDVGHRAVNPLKVTVQVHDGATPLGQPFDLTLRRDEHPTLIVNPDLSVRLLYSRLWQAAE